MTGWWRRLLIHPSQREARTLQRTRDHDTDTIAAALTERCPAWRSGVEILSEWSAIPVAIPRLLS
jgi:hypothetical protein